MTAPDVPDPDEYRPDPTVTAEEYTPEGGALDDPAREADPADVADQLNEVPTGDDERTDDDGDADV